MNRRFLRTIYFLLPILGVFLIEPIPAFAVGRIECRAMPSKILGRAVRYCALLPPSYDAEKARRFPVLYYLHGLGDNEQSLVNFGGWNMIKDLRDRGRIGEFLILAPDGGQSFYVNSKDGRVRYEDFFIREFVPFVDRTYRTQAVRTSRGITGVSMGGYGVLRLAFAYPHMFRAASAHMAALMERLPRVEVRGSPGERIRVGLLGTVFGAPADAAYFDRLSPLTLAKTAPGLSDLRIYFDCGSEDRYGFDAGARRLHEALQARGIPHEFHIYPGGHDWGYVAAHFPASLEFHSRAFGLGPSRK